MNESHSDTAIRLVSPSTEVRFEWRGFDGDDCYNDFQLVAATPDSSRRFEFGACANFGLRKLLKFFGDATQTTAGLGFRHPDIRYLDVHRSSEHFQIIVRFEGSGLHEEFFLQSPAVHIQGNTSDAWSYTTANGAAVTLNTRRVSITQRFFAALAAVREERALAAKDLAT